MPRRSRSRGTLSYAKPPLHLDELVDRLADRGLHIPDRDRARRYLRHIGYYRLSPYSIPFQQGRSDHEFRSGTSFDDVLDLYVFDRALRLLVMDALERVEVAVRAALTDQLATRHADSHWYLTPGHFQDRRKHTQLLQMIERTCDSQLLGIADAGQDHLVHRSALEHYVTTYGSPALPPSWLMVETLTIECLPQPPGAPRPHRCRRQRRSNRTRTGVLADDLRACPQHLCSPRSAVDVGLGVTPAIPVSPTISWPQTDNAVPEVSRKRLYPVLVSLQSVLDAVSPHSSWGRRLHDLLHRRPIMNLSGMGVPPSWASDPFWNRHLGGS